MKYFVPAAAAALLVASASAAQAGETYAQIDVGLIAAGKADMAYNLSGFGSGEVEADVSPGFLLTGAWGKELDSGIAVEGEMLISRAGVDDADETAFSNVLLMANAKYAFKTGKSWSPYIGAGVGYGQTRFEIDDAADEDTGVAWQLRAGFTQVSDTGSTWDIGYRYVKTPDFEITDGLDSFSLDASFHAVTVGMRF